MHDDQFTATGPSHHTSGKPKAAFSTAESGSHDFEFGAHVSGRRFGVAGTCSENSPNRAVAGVFGNARACRFGVLGVTLPTNGEEAGVVGASVGTLHPFRNFDTAAEDINLTVEGDGSIIGGNKVGVLGLSADGPGVSGESLNGSGGQFHSKKYGSGVWATSINGSGGHFHSETASGVWATSDTGSAIHGVSKHDRGGVFESGKGRAQIQLVPQTQGREPKLPKTGFVGDLLLIENQDHLGAQVCSLWLCVPKPVWLEAGAGAFWREIQLGNLVAGTD